MWERELLAAKTAAKMVINRILEIYHSQFAVEIKDDNSPVTAADKGADKTIREFLGNLFPEYGMLTEESEDNPERLNKELIWIVDPVDGTKDFVAHDDQFTTNIGLAYKGKVVVGVVSIPVTGEMYFASEGKGAYYDDGKCHVTQIHVSDKTSDLTMLTSKFHKTNEEVEYSALHKDRISKVESYGAAIKACRIAHGKAELNIRFANGTKEWDTAASQCIVQEAGGLFIKPDGTPLTYNRKDVYNREGFYCINRIENKF